MWLLCAQLYLCQYVCMGQPGLSCSSLQVPGRDHKVVHAVQPYAGVGPVSVLASAGALCINSAHKRHAVQQYTVCRLVVASNRAARKRVAKALPKGASN